jgi:predicted nucleic acid-binding protein
MIPILIDSGVMIAYYNPADLWFKPVQNYMNNSRNQFITTEPCLTEVMWLLQASKMTQNEFLSDLCKGLYKCVPLVEQDFARIAQLNLKYKDLGADFADLSLIAISERLNISRIACLDDDFNIYQRFGKQTFKRVFPE